ncbi:MAG: hypothetical protein GF388_05975 [Candidatus Aegiribacteria sp.]|nr:hypothetical protein [Candidatus Aegiribacteria sp.]
MKLEAGYQEEKEYGASGNRTGYQIVQGTRFDTELAASVSSGDYTAELKSVIGIKVGDVMHFTDSGGNYDEYHKITEIDQGTNEVTWTDAQWGATAGSADDTAEVLGFQLKTYRKAVNGTVQEVETELGEIWCTMESEVTDFYVENVHAQNKYLIATDLDSASSVGSTRPSNVSSTTYLTSGDDGTAPSGSDNWDLLIDNFDEDPVRFLCIPDDTAEAVNKAGETYCNGREDNPKWIYNLPSDQSKSQLITLGNAYQRSGLVLGVIVANWLEVSDPFATSRTAPAREVPNVGHVMGNWIRVIGEQGIHYVPAVKQYPLLGCLGVVGEQFKSASDRTDLAENGINVIQELPGYGINVRNFFTPSITTAYQFANGILMRDYIKISVVDSLEPVENQPNSLARIREDRTTVLNFLYSLWESGSTGSVPTGETFGQSVNDDGTLTSPQDHFEVVAGATNNPLSQVQLGERNIDVWFSYPAPAGSIKVGVGILLRS